ncbi:choice-of-anchor D domain-containing protein [Spirosoma sp. BT702]|uniref:Choice-of-anchor D domain-containing protein n=1 Tax=Spirosoma profusum TaxID=2771354 RepID=A0A927ATK8_9BACT|nr:YCF48-related protein [Spirosoma profusum]MBD2703770.1 choice-of-anchor D domain-containing protein [Spirosoma profusum]
MNPHVLRSRITTSFSATKSITQKFVAIILASICIPAFGQVSISANTNSLCEGPPVSISLTNSNPSFFTTGSLQRNGTTVASTTNGQLNYTTTLPGAYQFVYNEKSGFSDVYAGQSTFLEFTDMYFLNTSTGFVLSGQGIHKTSNGGKTWSKTAVGNNFNTAVHFSDSQNGWVVGWGGNINRTTDGGATWVTQPINFGYELYDVFATSSTTGWVVGRKNKVLYTSNGGGTWTDVNLSIPYDDASVQGIYFINQNTGWIVGQGGIIRKTTNGGSNWTSQSLPSPYAQLWITDVSFVDANTGWVSTVYGGVFKTTNGGASWTLQRAESQNSPQGTSRIRFNDANTGFYNLNSVVYRSTDGGTNWTPIGNPTFSYTHPNILSSFWFFSATEGFTATAGHLYKYYASLPDRTNIISITPTPTINANATNICANQPVQLSSNSVLPGTALQWLKDEVPVASATSLTYSPSQPGNYKLQATQSVDSWQVAGNGYYSFIDPTNGWTLNPGAGGTNNQVRRTTDGGQTSNTYSTVDGYLSSIYFVNTSNGWITGREDGVGYPPAFIARSTDGGMSWTKTPVNIDYSVLNGIYFTDASHGWIFGQKYASNTPYAEYQALILRTTDGGNTWIQQSSVNQFVKASKAFFVNNTTGWIAGKYGESAVALLKTTDGGNTWTQQLVIDDAFDINLFFKDAATGWVSIPGQFILMTTNGGSTWTAPSTQTNAGPLFFEDVLNGVMVSGSNLFRTSDGGQTWQHKATSPIGLTSAKFFTSNSLYAFGANGDFYRIVNQPYTCISAPIAIGTLCCTSMETVKTGVWNDPTVWSCGRVPKFSDTLTIRSGHIISLNETGYVKKLTILGTLRKGSGAQMRMSIIPPSALNLSGNMNFGQINVGQTASRTLVIQNTGSDVTVTGLTLPSGFSGSWNGILAMGSSQSVVITFAPGAAGTFDGQLTVNTTSVVTGNTISLTASATVNTLLNGLVLYLPFNGNANDASGNGNHGILTGAVIINDRFGNSNQACGFIRSNGTYLRVPNSPSLDITGSGLTICAWINPVWNGSGINMQVVSKAQDASNRKFGLGTGGPSLMNFELKTTTGTTDQDWGCGSCNLQESVWQFVTVTYDGSNMRWYKNGSLIYQTTKTGTIVSTNTDLIIGSFADRTQSYFNGSMDEIRIYNRALTNTEIQQLYQL